MTLSTSSEGYSKIIGGSLAASLLTALFGAVYEHFSFGVFSYYMIYAFMFSLVGGTVFWMLMERLKKSLSPAFVCLWNAALATFTMGAILHGILDIYGTSSPLINVFWAAGSADLIAAITAEIRSLRK